MSATLNELVRDQILAEAPQIEESWQREWYLGNALHYMRQEEFLKRISDALQKILAGVQS